MNTKHRFLLTAILLLGAISLKAQEAAYDHKIIAILPFKTTSFKTLPKGNDSVIQRLMASEAALSLEVQEAFYNAITADQDRLLVDVQNWQLTDSLLKAANLDFRKIIYADKQVLANLLKVDAVLAGEFNSHQLAGASAAPDVAAITAAGGAWALVNMMNRPTKLTVFLYDGKTGDPLWNFEKELVANPVFNNSKKLEGRLYKAFIKKFPYTR
ncbi:MAG TPA: hypothetical protein VGD35_23015 [Chitinophaga sp.]